MPLPVVIASKLLAPRFLPSLEWDMGYGMWHSMGWSYCCHRRLLRPAAPRSFHINRCPYLSTCISLRTELRIRGFGFGFTLLLAAYQSQLICTQNRTELNQTKNKKTENGVEAGEHLLRKIIPQLVTFCKIQSRRDRH